VCGQFLALRLIEKGVIMTKALFILPFDHRSSFEMDLFGISKRAPTTDEFAKICDYKKIIYEGFKMAVASGVAKNSAGILVDEEFGNEILMDARANGYITACSVEKSGQSELKFEYGSNFGVHILKTRPDYVKVLVRYDAGGEVAMNDRQAGLLNTLSNFCIQNNVKLIIELIIPLTSAQNDEEMKPKLMIAAIKELQEKGSEPSIWKVEGVLSMDACVKIAAQARSGARDQVCLIVLGGGKDKKLIEQMLTSAAKVPGYIGFAIGRTIWEAPLQKVKENLLLPEEASTEIAGNFKSFCDLWMDCSRTTTRE
jgi:myo-inositol catabolism protein IolC